MTTWKGRYFIKTWLVSKKTPIRYCLPLYKMYLKKSAKTYPVLSTSALLISIVLSIWQLPAITYPFWKRYSNENEYGNNPHIPNVYIHFVLFTICSSERLVLGNTVWLFPSWSNYWFWMSGIKWKSARTLTHHVYAVYLFLWRIIISIINIFI